MNKLTALGNLGIGAVAVAFLGGCATVGEPEVAKWNIPQPGSSWTVAQHNTGSYGKDIRFEIRRSDATWQGQPAVALANSVTGTTSLFDRDTSRLMAIVGRDGNPAVTIDPPIGFQFPLKVGKEWSTTHRWTVAYGSTVFVYSCKVESYEPVTVPAGTFNSFRIRCKAPGAEDVFWSSPDYGMLLKSSLRRFADHLQGPGTQEQELVALNLVK
jgi:hypothetical protein